MLHVTTVLPMDLILNGKVQNNVSPKVVKTYNWLRRVIKHYEMRIRSKEKLNKTLVILESVETAFKGGTRMTHFITVCKQLINFLPAAYNCMDSTDTKKKIGMHYSLLKHFCANFNE